MRPPAEGATGAVCVFSQATSASASLGPATGPVVELKTVKPSPPPWRKLLSASG
jgi:hypothetical protein